MGQWVVDTLTELSTPMVAQDIQSMSGNCWYIIELIAGLKDFAYKLALI